MSDNAKKDLTLSPARADHAAWIPFDLPDRIEEPFLSAFRGFHGRIRIAQEKLEEANAAWQTFAPVLREFYRLGPQDQIDAEGRIHRVSLVDEKEDA